jgi:2-polyprenyl-3-methyl-5-hydroxy-6-metoxy-1,4-benzoquinol methylase
MNHYMRGLLASYVLWLNHVGATHHFTRNFLPHLTPQTNLLEVGPGHGLLMYMASQSANVSTLTGWDVSTGSLEMTRSSLRAMDIRRPFLLRERNIFTEDAHLPELGSFDAIVLSEVLEHVEHPDKALRVLHALTRPGGRVWINVPANSPAPDHIYLLRHPDEAAKLVEEAGFDVVEAAMFPMAGATLQRAIKQELTINCVVIGQKS